MDIIESWQGALDKALNERDEATAQVRGAKAVICALVQKLGGGAPVHLDYEDILAAARVTLDVVEEGGGYTYRRRAGDAS